MTISRAHSITILLRFAALVLLGFMFAACASDPERDRLLKEEFPSYPEFIKRSIERHHPMRGMTHNQLFLAMGAPLCKTTARLDGKTKEVWMYPPGGAFPCTSAQYRVYFDDQGLVDGWKLVGSGPEGG